MKFFSLFFANSFAFAGVLSLISTWALNALYLSVTVFFADFCVLPDEYVLFVADKNHMKNCKFTFILSHFSLSLSRLHAGKISVLESKLRVLRCRKLKVELFRII